MQIERMKTAIVAGWILILAAVAMSLNVRAASGWLLLGAVGLLPSILLFRIWRQPARTMSESIREVLR